MFSPSLCLPVRFVSRASFHLLSFSIVRMTRWGGVVVNFIQKIINNNNRISSSNNKEINVSVWKILYKLAKVSSPYTFPSPLTPSSSSCIQLQYKNSVPFLFFFSSFFTPAEFLFIIIIIILPLYIFIIIIIIIHIILWFAFPRPFKLFVNLINSYKSIYGNYSFSFAFCNSYSPHSFQRIMAFINTTTTTTTRIITTITTAEQVMGAVERPRGVPGNL